MPKTTFELIREKYKKAQAEQKGELEEERKLMTADTKEHIYGDDSDSLVKPRREESSKRLKKLANLSKSQKS
jgi:hypothetical protein